jgi:hypothetical protein
VRQQEVFDGGDAASGAAEWDADVRGRALARLDRRPPRPPRFVRFGALAILGALHALLFWRWYASRFPPPASKPTVVQVRLLDAPAALPVPPRPASLRHARAMSAAMLPAPPPPPAAVPDAATSTGIEPLIFNRDGSIAMPPGKPTPLQAGLTRGRELLARGHNIIHCRRSRFDDAPTPAQAAAAAARGAHMAHLVMGNPLDPLNDVGQRQQEDGAADLAARKREIEEQACDWAY